MPATPLAGVLGFSPLPAGFFAALVGLVVGYIGLIEIGKRYFYRLSSKAGTTPSIVGQRPRRHLLRRIAYFSTARDS